jgi:hypothetical protein
VKAPFDALDAGYRSRTDPPARPSQHVADSDPVAWRSARWATALLLLITLTATLVALALFQATSEGASKRSLRRAVAALSEIDVLLDRNYDALHSKASGGTSNETYRLADFPIDVELTREEVLGSSRAQLRDLLLDRSADIMYREGTAPLRNAPGTGVDVGPFTAGGITDRWLGFLTRGHHAMLRVITLVLAGVSGLLCLALAALFRGFARLAGVGAMALVASLPLLAAGATIRLYVHFVSGSQTEYLQREFLAIGRGLAWIPIRDGLAVAALGALAVVVGAGCAALADRRTAARRGV